MAAERTRAGTWHRLRLVLYGKTVTPLVFRGTALWYGALREAPVRFVVVSDPSGRRHPVDMCHRHAATCQFGGDLGEADIDDADGRRQQAWRWWINNDSGSNPLIDNRTIPIISGRACEAAGAVTQACLSRLR